MTIEGLSLPYVFELGGPFSNKQEGNSLPFDNDSLFYQMSFYNFVLFEKYIVLVSSIYTVY
jgi:hypothetical protein